MFIASLRRLKPRRRKPPPPVGDEGGWSRNEPQSIAGGSLLCDNGELSPEGECLIDGVLQNRSFARPSGVGGAAQDDIGR